MKNLFLKKKILILIPARGGSTSIKDKNVIKLKNKPLIYYSYLASKFINEKSKIVVCTSDSEKIINICRKFGLKNNILRPKKYSTKYSLDLSFVNHALKYFSDKKIFFKTGLILRPTSPIRSKKNLNNAYQKFYKSNFDSMRAVIESPITPYKIWKIRGSRITPLIKLNKKEPYNMPRQKLPVTFWQTGNFEFFKINFKKKLNSISGRKIMGYKINKEQSLDIDNMDDIININKKLKKYF